MKVVNVMACDRVNPAKADGRHPFENRQTHGMLPFFGSLEMA
jgi:hypothetical protein